MITYEVHRKVRNNVGDYYCNPGRYFEFPEYKSGELMHNDFPVEGQAFIAGGGGLIHKKFQLHIERILDKKPKVSALWAVGHNFGKKHVNKKGGDVYYPSWINKATLIGIRDYIPGNYNTYLPCVSCMHTAFNKTYDIKHDVAYFTHAFKSKYEYKDGDIHMANSNMDFDAVIEFLGSAKTIITDSYHGAYWAQLLERDVRVLSWSVKFDHMKHQPTLIPHISQWQTSPSSPIVSGYLDECRELNNKFYHKFLNLL
jgi:hypothetical protein